MLLTGETEGWYEEFDSIALLAKAFQRPHVHDGTYSTFRKRRFGAPADDMPPERFVVFSADHDQVGNRALGDRLPVETRPLAAFCTLLSPFTPMLFQGEEYGERAPFQFFTDHIDPEIADATREGRRREFAAFAEFSGEEVPDPQDRATFERSKLTRAGEPEGLLRAAPRAAARRAAMLPAGDVDDVDLRRARRLARRPPRRVHAAGQLRPHARARAPRADRGGRAGHARADARARVHRPARPVRSARPLMEVWPGAPFPLGATWDGEGTNFSIFSEHAERVELCLFDAEDARRAIELTERTSFNWHCYLPGVHAGQRYGYRVHGPYDPQSGQRFNPAKLLMDPYAKSIEGPIAFEKGNVHPYVPTGGEDDDLTPDDSDDAAAIPKCVVIDPRFDWQDDRPPNTPLADSVIYETHVKGFTMQHPDVREDLRGTYAGLASDPAVGYLKDLGVTAVELLPVHHIADEAFLDERGLTNYWGYSTIGFLAPHSPYAATGKAGQEVREFKGMVKALHKAGIEVILDVVYNHTAEGNHLGPMLSFRGVDNQSYYRLVPDDPRHYMDYTGTGNTLNVMHPSVLRLIMDSLRYWVIDCHVDGFRFDLASRAGPRALRRRPPVARSSTSSTRTRSSPRSS